MGGAWREEEVNPFYTNENPYSLTHTMRVESPTRHHCGEMKFQRDSDFDGYPFDTSLHNPLKATRASSTHSQRDKTPFNSLCVIQTLSHTGGRGKPVFLKHFKSQVTLTSEARRGGNNGDATPRYETSSTRKERFRNIADLIS